MSRIDSNQEITSARILLDQLEGGHIPAAIETLRALVETRYAEIPQKQRISRGITWVVEQVSQEISTACVDPSTSGEIARVLFTNLPAGERLQGVPIFMMASSGQTNPDEVLPFFEQAAQSPDWVVREFTAGAFRQVIAANKDMVYPWLRRQATCDSPQGRRFVVETLRPVTHNRWLNRQPEYSLSILRLLFREAHPYPRTSVGNNLSDLSRRQPELIYAIVQELVAMDDTNSYWIAYRACRNLVKKDPQRVMTLLKVKEYHYKDWNY